MTPLLRNSLGKILNLNSNSIMFVILSKLHKFSMFLTLEKKDCSNGCIVQLLGGIDEKLYMRSL